MSSFVREQLHRFMGDIAPAFGGAFDLMSKAQGLPDQKIESLF